MSVKQRLQELFTQNLHNLQKSIQTKLNKQQEFMMIGLLIIYKR